MQPVTATANPTAAIGLYRINAFQAGGPLVCPLKSGPPLRYGVRADGGHWNGPEETHGGRDCCEAAADCVLTSQGRPVAEAVRAIGVTEVTYYRWRTEYGGLKGDQVKRMKELEAENARLRRAVSDLTVEKLILKEAAAGNF
jgi:putative transposase